MGADYDFLVTETGPGAALFNVGDSGDAFGVADNSDVAILDLLLATNARTTDGVLYEVAGMRSSGTSSCSFERWPTTSTPPSAKADDVWDRATPGTAQGRPRGSRSEPGAPGEWPFGRFGASAQAWRVSSHDGRSPLPPSARHVPQPTIRLRPEHRSRPVVPPPRLLAPGLHQVT